MEVACNLAPFAVASNNNLNPVQDNFSAKLSQQNGNSITNNGNNNKYNNNINNNILVQPEYDSSQPVIEKIHRVKFLDMNSSQQNLVTDQDSNPQLTVSHHEQPRNEDNSFGTKIDNSYQGWDNPFRPEGELSHDAEEILRLWKEGKLKDFSLLLTVEGDHQKAEEEHKKAEDEPLISNGNGHQQNGMKMDTKMPPIKSEKVTVIHGDDEPKKKQGCCSLM